MTLTHVERGRHAETIAASFLSLNGYHILARNFRSSRLEIDLIARGAGGLIAIIEVKYRRRSLKGGAIGAVGITKQRDIETATVGFLRSRGLSGVRVRFDVVVIEGEGPSALRIRHLPGAFQASGRYRL